MTGHNSVKYSPYGGDELRAAVNVIHLNETAGNHGRAIDFHSSAYLLARPLNSGGYALVPGSVSFDLTAPC